jgi:dTMP kinase
LEGLDGTGKSTQLERIAGLFSEEPSPLFTHQPSGAPILGRFFYEMTNDLFRLPALALQLLHLASHAEHYQELILPALTERAVVMDRCWWSTVAYGYYGAALDRDFSRDEFEHLARAPACGRLPDLVLVFLEEAEVNEHIPRVREGYLELMSQFPDSSLQVFGDSISEVTEFIINVLEDRSFIVPTGN